MNKKVFVGNLSYSVSEMRLEEVFSEYGTVESVKIITDKYTGKSRGFGFVEMSEPEEAQNAIEALNGTDLEGRNIVVNKANPPKSRSDSGDRGSRW